jgi:hypothetical protein
LRSITVCKMLVSRPTNQPNQMPDMIDVADKERQALDPKLQELLEDAEQPAQGFIYCGRCSHVVARQSDRIELNGAHSQVLTNPHGFRFHVGCFSNALGCAISGEREAADSWFAGYCWRIASCEQCHTHLGWYFDRAEDYFYGLILDNVQSD